MIATIHHTGLRENLSGFFTEAAPSSPPSESFSSRQTQALLPAELVPAGSGDPEAAQQQDVNGRGQELSRQADRIREAAERASQYMKRVDTHLEFKVGEQTGRVVIKVIDSDTQEVVREIPPEQMQRIAEQLNQMRGLLFETHG